MLIQLLDYLQNGKTYSIQDLADFLHKDIDSVQVELEYLEHQGYIRKVITPANCKEQYNSNQSPISTGGWEVIKRK